MPDSLFRIVVVSDSHGNTVKLQRIIEKEGSFDLLVHCGDGVSDLFHVNIPPDAAVVRVPGNVDLGRVHGMDRVVTHDVAGKRIMVTHGDLFGVRNGFGDLVLEARNRDAHIIFFGHTHQKYLSFEFPLLFNPGPATDGVYGVVTAGDRWEFTHRYIDM